MSKKVLSGEWGGERVRLRSREQLSTMDVGLILEDPAVALDAATRTVRTASGRALRASFLVVATGLRPREITGQSDLQGVHVLRTLDDSAALRAELLPESRAVIVGDGALGCEIAATARGMGSEVTVVGPQPAPMFGRFGPLVSGLLADLHTERGVHLRTGAAATELTGAHGRVTGVRLESGEVLPADVVVVALGADPVTDWLAGSGLRVDDGVVCDSRCEAAEGIYAVGDVARWRHDPLGSLLRLENRTNATEQAGVVAANILGENQPYTPVPHFWTDQFDAKIQVHGFPDTSDDLTIVDGDVADRRFVALSRRNGVVTGVLGWNMPKQTRLRRQELVEALGRTTRRPREVATAAQVSTEGRR